MDQTGPKYVDQNESRAEKRTTSHIAVAVGMISHGPVRTQWEPLQWEHQRSLDNPDHSVPLLVYGGISRPQHQLRLKLPSYR
jgi:hypothetical protein